MTEEQSLQKHTKKSQRGKEAKRNGTDAVRNGDDEEAQLRRLRKHVRRQEKRIKELRKQGLDENGEPFHVIEKYPLRECKVKVPCSQEPITLNPVVTALSIVGLWGLVIWCIVSPSGSADTMYLLLFVVSVNFGWLLQGSKAVIFFFLLYVVYKYGHIRLGRTGDKPSYSNLSYFAMILATGAGPFILTSLAGEALRLRTGHFFANTGYRSQDESDLFAITMVANNLVAANWVHFALVAACVSLVTHRFKLPMMFRSCFYPILGIYTWSWIGDLIDATIIMVSIAGSCDNLFLTADAIASTLRYTGWTSDNATEDEAKLVLNMIIWVITIVSTITVLYGLQNAIKITSTIALFIGSVLAFLVWAMDDTKFLLNLVVQELGYFLQTSIFELNFWTDAFSRIDEGSGRAVDGKASDVGWMDTKMLLYLAWVICMAASFGTFVASISHGRKLWEVVMYTLAVSPFYCLVWMCIWNGIGLRQHRQGKEIELLGETYFNNSAHFLASGSEVCYDVPQSDVVIGNDVVFTNYMPGITPVCQYGEEMNLNVLYSFSFPESFGASGLGPLLTLLCHLGMVLYLIASADSVTLVVDSLVSNGHKNNHWMRRLFWSCTVGAMTTALLSSGGRATLYAALIVMSLPVTIMMCYLPRSVMLMCQVADTDETDAPFGLPNYLNEFHMPIYGGVFNILEYVASWGDIHASRVELGMHRVTRFQVVEFAKGSLVPFVSLNQVVQFTYPDNHRTNTALVWCYALCYYGWLALLIVSWTKPGVRGCVWTTYALAGVILAFVRSGFRSTNGLHGNFVDDLTSSLLCWPQVLVQMRLQCTVSTQHTNQGTDGSKKKEESEAGRRDDDVSHGSA